MGLSLVTMLRFSFYIVLIGALIFSVLSRHYTTRDLKKAKNFATLSVIFSVLAVLSLIMQ